MDNNQKQAGPLPKNFYTQNQLIKSASLEKTSQLLALGYKAEQIVRIASNIGGSKTLNTLLEKTSQLLALGYKAEQIVRIASNRGGSQALNTLLEKTSQLLALGYKAEQIVRIASNDGGSQALNTLLEKTSQLLALGYKTEQIVKTASNRGGSQALNILLEKAKILQNNNTLASNTIFRFTDTARQRENGARSHRGASNRREFGSNGLNLDVSKTRFLFFSSNQPKRKISISTEKLESYAHKKFRRGRG